jgi:Chalcone isomerase-like
VLFRHFLSAGGVAVTDAPPVPAQEEARPMSLNRRLLVTVAVVLAVAGLVAAEMVGVPGSNTKFPSMTEIQIADKPVRVVLTGTALRTRYWFNVYAIGSYVELGVNVHSAEHLIALDCPKQLHLVMERDVDGKDMAEAFKAAIRLNHDEPAFADEIGTFTGAMLANGVKKGDHIYLTNVPKVGLRCAIGSKPEFMIENPAFARAVWDIYFGQNNLGREIKEGLMSRL